MTLPGVGSAQTGREHDMDRWGRVTCQRVVDTALSACQRMASDMLDLRGGAYGGPAGSVKGVFTIREVIPGYGTARPTFTGLPGSMRLGDGAR